jgi:hypothetical protein
VVCVILVMKKLVFLICLLLLAACTKHVEPAPVNETPVVNETVSEPEETLGRVVVAIGASGNVSVDSFVLQLTDLEAYDAKKDSWKKLTSTKTEFDLTGLYEENKLFIDTPLDPAQYTKLRFRINNADAMKDETEYDVSVPYSTITVDAILNVLNEENAFALAILVIDTSGLTIVGEKGYFKPSISVTTRTRGELTILSGDKVSAEGGDIETDEKNGVLDLYTAVQVASMMSDCSEDCVDACSGNTEGCQSTCEDGVEAGCESEDEDICREHCETYLTLFDCRDGCQEDDAAECTDYLQDRCGAGCDDSYAECNMTCTTNCR